MASGLGGFLPKQKLEMSCKKKQAESGCKKIMTKHLLFAIAFTLLALPADSQAFDIFKFLKNPASPKKAEHPYVAEVFDGDTIKLNTGEIVRYIGIDTPELHEKKAGRWENVDEPFAREAYLLNKSLVQGKRVQLVFDKEEKDRYGRLLCYVFAGNVFVNERLLREGLAFPYPFAKNSKYRELLAKAFLSAFNGRKNIYRNVLDTRNINSFIGKVVWHSGKVNQVFAGKGTTIISGNIEIVLKGGFVKKGNVRKGGNVYAYGKLSRNKGRYLITVMKRSHFFAE